LECFIGVWKKSLTKDLKIKKLSKIKEKKICKKQVMMNKGKNVYKTLLNENLHTK
jgi:hypothetical protein